MRGLGVGGGSGSWLFADMLDCGIGQPVGRLFVYTANYDSAALMKATFEEACKSAKAKILGSVSFRKSRKVRSKQRSKALNLASVPRFALR